MSRNKVLDRETTAAGSYFQEPEDAARLSLERALRDAFPIVQELPTNLIQLVGRLATNTAKQV
jgi:hypothetical protein